MKIYLALSILILTLVAGSLFIGGDPLNAQNASNRALIQSKEMPEVILLAGRSKQGAVSFNHVKHNGGEYNAGGPILCIECHHTAQPAADLIDVPPHKTVWPAGRTTTLTVELYAEDPIKAGVAACRDCHARSGEIPKLLKAIPVITDPETKIKTKITNERAFHSACDTCHFQIGFRTTGSKVPNATNCSSCHKVSAKITGSMF